MTTSPAKKFFIVGPSAAQPDDTLHHVCSCVGRESIFDSYMNDTFEQHDSTDNLDEARSIAKSLGAKRVKVI